MYLYTNTNYINIYTYMHTYRQTHTLAHMQTHDPHTCIHPEESTIFFILHPQYYTL